mgnify:CR=1 FL=1|jgi:hypothetical protein|tara:strand:+ start:291 stop:1019 length:729 start_codon:yes stop_codon:yes gene_type:complete
MKAMLKIGLGVTLVLQLFGCQLTRAPSEADAIIARYIEATGGRAAQEAVNSMIVKGGAYIASAGLEADMLVYYKNGNYKRVIEVPGMVQVVFGVTGDIAWQVNPLEGDSVLEGPGAVYQREDANINALLNWKDTYQSAKVMGEESGATVVVFTASNGAQRTRHFDKTSGLMTKEIQADPSGGFPPSTFADYKRVGDITMAHKLIIESDQGDIEITLEAVELNAPIDDNNFDIPDVIKSLLAD